MANRILVTGSRGFLGRELGTILNHSNFHVVPSKKASLEDSGYVEELLKMAISEKCDTLLHLAWASNSLPNYKRSPSNYVWAKKTVDIAKKCFEAKIKFCGVGSIAELNDFAESNYYAITKREAQRATQEISENFMWIRPSHIISLNHGKPGLVREIRECGGPVVIRNGNESQDFILLKDVLHGVRVALEEDFTGIVDIGSGQSYKVSQVAKVIARELGKPEPIIAESNEKNNPPLNPHKLVSKGWRPTFTTLFFQQTVY